MKKTYIALLLIIAVFTMSGCSSLEVNGLENFSTYTCSVELTKYLFPHENFTSLYEYKEGGYQYLDKGDLAWGNVRAFAYLSYEPEIYEKAKKYCLDTFVLCENHKYEYNGYQFNEHLCHSTIDEKGELDVGCDFPQHFNMFGYYDESYTLFFLGYYNGNPKTMEKDLTQDNWGEFLQEVYADFYNFSN